MEERYIKNLLCVACSLKMSKDENQCFFFSLSLSCKNKYKVQKQEVCPLV